MPRGAPAQKQSQPAAAAPGQFFGYPGLTQPTSHLENNDGIAVTLASATSKQVTGMVPWKQTDVICWWELDFAIAPAVAAGGGALTLSAYFPYNSVGAIKLQIQNMYANLDVPSGIDAALFQMFRPMGNNRPADQVYMEATPDALWAGATASLEANLVTTKTMSSATTAVPFTLEIPGALFFDVYWDLDKLGQPQGAPQRTIVSPQYMGSTSRIVQPEITFAPGLASNTDQGPYVVVGGAPTYTGTATIGQRRQGYYGGNDPRTLPRVWNWQYVRQAKQFSIAGRSVVDIPVPNLGQILLIYVRLFDPAAASNVGAPIALSAVTKCSLLFGSGLLRHQDTPKSMQKRYIDQHGMLLPIGVIVWDEAIDEFGQINNYKALNTYTTSGVTVRLEFTGAQSASAYAVVGVEALTFVQ